MTTTVGQHEAVALHAKRREKIGSRYARRIREAGGLPAVVYGHKQEPTAITLPAHETILAIQKGERVFKLDIEGGSQEYVLLKDLGFDHLGTGIVHADFARVDLDERVRAHVRLRFLGEDRAPGMKTVGAVMVHNITAIDVECAVLNIPDVIEVDLSSMEGDDVVHARDIQLPFSTMKLVTDPDTVVCSIQVKQIAEPTPGEAEVVTGAAEPARVEKKKEE